MMCTHLSPKESRREAILEFVSTVAPVVVLVLGIMLLSMILGGGK